MHAYEVVEIYQPGAYFYRTKAEKTRNFDFKTILHCIIYNSFFELEGASLISTSKRSLSNFKSDERDVIPKNYEANSSRSTVMTPAQLL